jgi:hypothetical protein
MQKTPTYPMTNKPQDDKCNLSFGTGNICDEKIDY